MIIRFLKKQLALIVIMMLSFVIHLYFLLDHPGSIYNDPERFGQAISTYGSRDASLYAEMAWQLLNDGFYGYNAEESNAYVTPSQPLYLAGLFKLAVLINTNHVMLYRLSNMILSLLTVLFIFLISKRLFNVTGAAVISALMYTTAIAPLHYFRASLSETPAMFMLLLTIWIFLIAMEKRSFWWHAGFGIAASILLMFRPTPAPLLLAAWGIVIYRIGLKEAIKVGFIWTIGPLVIMLPWVVRNILVLGEVYLFSSHGGEPMLAGTNPFFLVDHATLTEYVKVHGLTKEGYAFQRMKEGFAEDFPLWFSWFTVGKFIWLFVTPNGSPEGLGPYLQDFNKWVLLYFKWQYIITVIGGLLAGYFGRRNKKVLSLSFIIAGYILISLFFLTIPRYGFFIYPLISILFGYGVIISVRSLKASYKKLTIKKRML